MNAPHLLGRIRRRLALALILTALIPLLVAVWLAESAVRHASARFFIPEVGTRLDQSLELYQELAHSIKARMRAEARAIASGAALSAALHARDESAITQALERSFPTYEDLVSLAIRDPTGARLASVDRGRAVDPRSEKRLRVVEDLGEAELVAVFATDRARFDQFASMGQFVETYKTVESRRHADERSYVLSFALLLGITIVAAVGVGILLSRGVTSRIDELARATDRVGAGDLSVRVVAKGQDEIADLARAFNRMLAEVEESRGRIEYLQRISAWQEMARRLAHEIKNPLTPIQLAVQEAHRRYRAGDAEYKKLLDATLEVVEDEVATLRRLVSEFSDFARLPRAKLEEGDLAAFLREQAERANMAAPERDSEDRVSGFELDASVDVRFDIPDGLARVRMDRLMLRRALVNLVENAIHAVKHSGRSDGLVKVSLSPSDDAWVLDVDDNGPGIEPDQRALVFDPYVTQKSDGSGLGLAIVKKIAMEHGGSAVAQKSPLGGARLRLRLPRARDAA